MQLNLAQKKLNKLAKAEQEKEDDIALVGSGAFQPVEEQADEVLFQPNKGPQTDFLAAPEREVLYGGAAGGGKSFALIVDPLRYCNNQNFNALILRRTNDELRELIHKSQEMYPKAYPGAKWMEKKSQWTFPSGARIWMTYLEQDKDVLRYQGQAFTYIGIDELTQYSTPYAWDYLRSRLRTADPSLPVYMRATTNPGGPATRGSKKCSSTLRYLGSPSGRQILQRAIHLYIQNGTAKLGSLYSSDASSQQASLTTPTSTSREIMKQCCSLCQRFNASNCLKAHGI